MGMALYRGSGGTVWDIELPAEGTNLRQLYEEQIRDGKLVLVDEPEPETKPVRRQRGEKVEE